MLIRLDNTAYHQPTLICLGQASSKNFAPIPAGGSCAVSVELAKALESEIRAVNKLRSHRVLKDARGEALQYREISLFVIDDDGKAEGVDAETLFGLIADGDVK